MRQKELVISTIDTMTLSMKSVGNHVYNRLSVESNKESYKVAMAECISYMTSGLENLDIIKIKINSLRDEFTDFFPKKRSLFSSKEEDKKHYNMAIDQALDIINSLEKRFITGVYSASSLDPMNSTAISNKKNVF